MKLFLINIMYWIYLYSDSFIWQNNKEFLIYNTSSHNSIQGKCIGNLKTIILGLHNTINLYCIEVEERVCREDKCVRTFLTDLRKSLCGNFKIKTSNVLERPISLPPIPNVQSEISRRKDKMNFDYLSYINHIEINYGKKTNVHLLANSLNDFLRTKPSINITLLSEEAFETKGALGELLKRLSLRGFHISLTLPYNYYIKNSYFIDSISSLIQSLCITTNCQTNKLIQIPTTSPFKEKFTIQYNISDIKEYTLIARFLHEKKLSFPVRFCFEFANKDSALAFISFTKTDVLNRRLSKTDIYRHMLINSNFFGRLKVKEDGSITSPCSERILSNIRIKNSWNTASKYECERPNSEWFLTRSSIGTICKNCLLNHLCPSPSEIEIKNGICCPCKS